MIEEIIIKDYFNIVRDDYGRIIMIENIGDDRELIKAIRKQNELIYELEQENKALQAYKDVNEDFKKAWDELNGKYKQLRSALEKINRTLLGVRGLSINCDKQIIKVKAIIREVLNDN